MPDTAAENTSASLLERLRLDPGDQAAWDAFVRRYSVAVYDWCRRWGLQDADARDVTQAVLLKMVRRLRTFRYDPARSFRRWLRAVARGAWADFLADRPKARTLTAAGQDALRLVAGGDDLAARLDAEFDREVLEEAQARVRLKTGPKAWEAFRLTGLERLSGAEAAARLGTTVAAVFKAKSKVMKLLADEVRRLEKE